MFTQFETREIGVGGFGGGGASPDKMPLFYPQENRKTLFVFNTLCNGSIFREVTGR